jgi:16S rRNA processing protein RimM
MNKLAPIGKFSRLHGLKGQLVLTDDYGLDLSPLKTLFIGIGGDMLPMFVTRIRPARGGFLVELEDIDSADKARPFIGLPLYSDNENLRQQPEEDEPEYAGYELVDMVKGTLGKITGFDESSGQALLSLVYLGKEIQLPFVPELVERIDHPEKKIFYRTPDGLLEIFME